MLRVIHRFVRKNLMLKLFSLALASMLWLTIASESNSVINRTVPLAFRGIPSNMEITGESATEVNLQLRGSSNLLNEISPADVAAVISLAGQGTGTYSFNLTSSNIQAPFGVEVLRIDPPRVEFKLERTLTRTIRVHATLAGEPSEGYVVADSRVDPPTAQVIGPESHVTPLDSLPTLPVNVEGARGSARRTIDLDITDPLIRLASVSAHDVFVEIREIQEETSFRAVPAEELIAAGWDVEPAEIMVHVSGPRSAIGSLDANEHTFTVEADDLEPGTYSLRPEIPGLGDGIDVTATIPETVTVRFRQE